MSADLDDRLKEAVTERDRLAAEAQRLLGKKEAAQKALESVEKEIREKNLDPDSLDETIEQLEIAYESAIITLEEAVANARDSLSPYMESET